MTHSRMTFVKIWPYHATLRLWSICVFRAIFLTQFYLLKTVVCYKSKQKQTNICRQRNNLDWSKIRQWFISCSPYSQYREEWHYVPKVKHKNEVHIENQDRLTEALKKFMMISLIDKYYVVIKFKRRILCLEPIWIWLRILLIRFKPFHFV